MVSAIDRAKRAFIVLIRALAVVYKVKVEVSRDSEDSAVNHTHADARLATRTPHHPHRNYTSALGRGLPTAGRIPVPKVRPKKNRRHNLRKELVSNFSHFII